MSHSRKNQPYKGADMPFSSSNKKIKKVRQSQPNLIIEDPTFHQKKLKDDSLSKKQRLQRKPRMSQSSNMDVNLQYFNSPQHQTQNDSSRIGFHSPGYIKKSTFAAKNPSYTYFHTEVDPIRFASKTQTLIPQNKGRKNAIQSHKETLNKIQQMLLSHGVTLNISSKSKKPQDDSSKKIKKQPRFSEDVLHASEVENKIQRKPKESQMFSNNFVISEQDQEDTKILKQTVSTLSSCKNSKQMKISDFQLGKQLGKGKFGTVKIARHKKTGFIFSIKIIKKSVLIKQQLVDQFVKEVKIQSFLNHSNVIKLYGIFDDQQNVYLLLELCCQGNLYHHLQKKRKFQQYEAKPLIRSICQGVSQLHQHNIIHRDLKPQNIVMCYGMAKICDFGWSTQYKDVMRETFCGTPLYVSPQLLSGNSYDEKVDLWAIGVLAYQILVGKIPFDIKSEKDLHKIISSRIVFPSSMSNEATSFLQDLLCRQPTQRKTVSQMLSHPFLHRK